LTGFKERVKGRKRRDGRGKEGKGRERKWKGVPYFQFSLLATLPSGDQLSPKWAWSGPRDAFQNFTRLQEYL